MKKLLTISLFSILMNGCKKEKIFGGPNFYEDNFEAYSTIDNLVLIYPDVDKYWSFTQITKGENKITLDSINVHSGNRSLKFFAKKTDDGGASKASISKQHMAFWEGETMRVSAWYFIENTNKLDWIFLVDIEEQTAIGAGPGMRLTLVDNRLRVEYKFNEKDIVQTIAPQVDFPRNQWVELIWEVKLSRKKKGTVKLWQDGQLIINSSKNTTLPKDILYFQQGTKGMYSQVEFGITANSRDNDVTIWVDDIKVEKAN